MFGHRPLIDNITRPGGYEGRKDRGMKLNDLRFEKIENYDPFNSRAKGNGMVTEWVARNDFGNAVAFGNTKKECVSDARRYIARQS